jgi:hypothetical protein
MNENILKEAEDVPDVMNAKLFLNYMQEKIPGMYLARTHEQMLSLLDIAASAKANGRYDGDIETLVTCGHIILREAVHKLYNGNAVNLAGIIVGRAKISGTFETPYESTTQHRVTADFYAGNVLRELFANARINIEGIAESDAYLHQVTDVSSGTANVMLTPGGMFTLEGNKIRVTGNPDDKSGTGVCFVSQSGTPQVKVWVDTFAINKASQLIGLIPQLPTDQTWDIEVHTRYNGSGHPLKEIRTIVGGWQLPVATATKADDAPSEGVPAETAESGA